jgi:hypothetical protein
MDSSNPLSVCDKEKYLLHTFFPRSASVRHYCAVACVSWLLTGKDYLQSPHIDLYQLVAAPAQQ